MKSESVVTIDDLPADVIEAIRNGRKIEAIKSLRMATGLGLANAKVLVEAAARQHGVATQPSMMSEHGGSGTLVRILLFMLIGAGVWYYLQ